MAYPDWHDILKNGITNVRDLPAVLPPGFKSPASVLDEYPMFINTYFAGLIARADDALARQVIPDPRELDDRGLVDDPLTENRQSPVAGVIHRYPDRVVFLVSNRCAILCRFCMRKRLAGRSAALTAAEIAAALDYIRENKNIREVILSGGDPLLLEDDKLDYILATIRGIDHVQVIRIHSRVPCALPQRITPELAEMLKKYHPLYLNIHFNHPDEVTETAASACIRLAEAGIPLGSQTVLLKNVNDSAGVIEHLMRRLLNIRVKPYYLHHPDLVRGTAHFRVAVKDGLAIMQSLQGRLSGSAIPRYMVDLPAGGGKIPLSPEFVRETKDGMMIVKNFAGEMFAYPLDA